MLDGGRWTLDVGRWTLDVGRWTLNVGRWTLDVGRWTLDVGRWTLDVGRWTLDVQAGAMLPNARRSLGRQCNLGRALPLTCIPTRSARRKAQINQLPEQ